MKNMWWCGFLLCFIIEEMEKKPINLPNCPSQLWNTLGAFFVVFLLLFYFGGLFLLVCLNAGG